MTSSGRAEATRSPRDSGYRLRSRNTSFARRSIYSAVGYRSRSRVLLPDCLGPNKNNDLCANQGPRSRTLPYIPQLYHGFRTKIRGQAPDPASPQTARLSALRLGALVASDVIASAWLAI